MRLAALPFEGRPRGQLRGERGSAGLRGIEIRHRAIGLGLRPFVSCARLREPSRGFVPSRVGRRQERRRELVPDARTGRLLIGLCRESTGLRAELGQDVFHAGEVRLRLGQLLFGLPPPALVASNAGHFLEQRTSFLGPQGQRLVDHALADEQERVVGQVRAVQEIDEVAQADALLVEQVLVLAAPKEPASELEDLELDRQEPIAVVEDQRDVGHALSGALLRPGPDDVFRLAGSEGAPLLPECPAERVGQIALARPVRPDDRADPATELDVRSLRERLESLETEREQTRSGGSRPRRPRRRGAGRRTRLDAVGHAFTGSSRTRSSSRSVRMRSIASAAAAVSAIRREAPSPVPSSSPSTQTWIRNDFS